MENRLLEKASVKTRKPGACGPGWWWQKCEKWSDAGYILKIKSAGLSDKKNEGVEG